MSTPSVVCGIDLGSASTPSYVAWLDDRTLRFDLYRATPERPLPDRPDGRTAAVYALDGPQGLPADPGGGARACRVADRMVHTPTQSLPTTASGLRDLRLYGAFVRNAVALFWRLHETGAAAVLGLRSDAAIASLPRPLVCETWPRLVLRRLAGDGRTLPPKRSAPEAYARAVWRLVQGQGLEAPGVLCPTVDQVDAALCAVAARAVAEGSAEALGLPPWPDPALAFLREGLIVVPPAPDGVRPRP